MSSRPTVNILDDRADSVEEAKGARVSEDVELQDDTIVDEVDYPFYFQLGRLMRYLNTIENDGFWNWIISVIVMLSIIQAFGDPIFPSIVINAFDIIYLIYCIIIVVNVYGHSHHIDVVTTLQTLVDIATFLVYAFDTEKFNIVGIACYYARLHRPFAYLWALNEYHLKLTVAETAWKYLYIFMIFRITYAFIWDVVQSLSHSEKQKGGSFWSAFYIVDKMFTPIGPPILITTDVQRITCMVIMITGCLVVTGAAIASLSLVISIYLRPEETFRARYRLIIKEMRESRVPLELQEKVQTFYKMYWSKQGAVSTTQLLPIFPPSLPATVFTEKYFEATQKSRVLRNLSYEFLWQLAQKMSTINYIPGDTIIKRNDSKNSVIYIAYGDIDMLTAEDDLTPILRMTRGTVLTPCGVCPVVGGGRAHVEIRAATFCTAHVINATDLWRTVLKYGENNNEAYKILSAFLVHIERVKRHFYSKPAEIVLHKSSIKHFKQNLMELKEKRDENGDLLLARSDVFLEVAGCYVMRNQAEASLADESDAICLRPTFPCILQPESSLLVMWNIFVACITVVVCITHPYYLVYKKDIPIYFRMYDYVVTFIYVVDLVVYLSTGINVEEGVPITFVQTSWQQVRTFWFILDMLGTLPLFEFILNGDFAGINKLLRIPRVFRVLKGIEDTCVYHSNVIRFFSYTLMMLIACYLIAAWQQGFMCLKYGYCVVTNFTHVPFWEYGSLDEETTADRLYFSLYWAISVITFTTHYETFTQQKDDQVLFMMAVIEISIVLHIFIEALYSATIMVTAALREDFDGCISNVKKFLIRNDLDPMLRQRFITYLQLCWYTDKAYSMSNRKSSIFFDLPPHVYQEIVARQRSKYILSIPFMKFLRREDLKKISSEASLFYTSPNEIILNTGDICNEIYVIKQGICEVFDPETNTVVSSLSVKKHFGVLECMLRIPAYYTVRAVTHVQILSISRKFLVNVMEIPKVKDAIEFAKEQPEYFRLTEFREPILMYQPPEPTPNRMMFDLPRKHEQDTDFLQPFMRLGFLSVMRYIYPRFTIRPDGKYLMQYEWFRLFCALASSLIFPLYSYLVLQFQFLQFITFLLDFSAYFDIFQRMLIGYFDENGVLIYHPLSTSGHYLKGSFVVDLIACLPLENLDTLRKESFGPSNTTADANMYRVTEARQFLMLNRQLQLYRLPGAMNNFSDYLRRDIQLILHAIPLFAALINILTCFIVFSSVQIFYTMDGGDWYIVPIEKDGASWITIFNNAFRFNVTESPWNMFLASYFWVTYETTTTGYNNIRPSSRTIMLVLFFGLFVSAMLITYYSVRIISSRANVNKPLATYQEHLKDMMAFMNKEDLSYKLQREVILFYAYNWKKKCGVDSRQVLKLCKQITLRTDAILNLYGRTFEKCSILADLDKSLIRIVGRGVRSMYFLKQMRVFIKDDVISDILIVHCGTVEVQEETEDVCLSVKLKRGSVFGNIACKEYVRSSVTIVASTDVHLLQINAVTFLNIISEFPNISQRFQTLRQENDSYIRGQTSEDEMKLDHDRAFSYSMLPRRRRTIVNSLHTHNLLVQIYLMLVCIACIFADLYNAGFQDNRPGLILCLYVLDLLFYTKIIIRFLSPIITQDIEMKMYLLRKRKTYLCAGFKYDILSCLPIELLSFLSSGDSWLTFSFLRLNRMFRIMTMKNCLRRYHEKIMINLALITVISVFTWFSLFVHATTCIWHFIGLVEDMEEPQSSWMYKDKPTNNAVKAQRISLSGGVNIINSTGESWCDSQYICSLYFILTTFTQNGVGDIMPKKKSEVVFVSLLQIISVMICMIYVGEFSNIIQYQSFRSFSYHFKCLELRSLVKLVNKYSLHLWRESRGLQMPHFLKAAPNCIKLKVMSEAYMRHFLKIPVFQNCEPAFLRQLVGYLRLYTYDKDMFVVKENEITDSMYLVHKGKVVAVDKHLKFKKVYGVGECFGLLQGLLRNLRFSQSYRTHVKSQVLTLRLNDWEYLLKLFPISNDEIHKHINFDDPDLHRSSRMPFHRPFNSHQQPPPPPGSRPHTAPFLNEPHGSNRPSRPSYSPEQQPSPSKLPDTVGRSISNEKLGLERPKTLSLGNLEPTRTLKLGTSSSKLQVASDYALWTHDSKNDVSSRQESKLIIMKSLPLLIKDAPTTSNPNKTEQGTFTTDVANLLQYVIIKIKDSFTNTGTEHEKSPTKTSIEKSKNSENPSTSSLALERVSPNSQDYERKSSENHNLAKPHKIQENLHVGKPKLNGESDQFLDGPKDQPSDFILGEQSQSNINFTNAHYNSADDINIVPEDFKDLTPEQRNRRAMDSDVQNENDGNESSGGPSEEQSDKKERISKDDRNSRKNK